MMVSSGRNSREVNLNGRLIGVIVSTPGSAANRLARTSLRGPTSPTTAMTIRSAPAWSYGVIPSARMWLLTPRTSASVALAAITTNIAVRSPRRSVGQTKKQRSHLCFVRPARPVPPVLSTGNVHAGHRK